MLENGRVTAFNVSELLKENLQLGELPTSPRLGLTLLKILSMMDIKEVLLEWFIIFLIKSTQVKVLNMKRCHTSNYLENYTNQLLENLNNEKYTHILQTLFGVMILPICY